MTIEYVLGKISILRLLIKVKNLKPISHCDAKPLALGPGVGLDPQRHNFVLGIPTCWYPKRRKFSLPLTPNLKFAFLPTQNPNASQWNIGCVGSQTQISPVGHEHFIILVLISFALGSQFPVKYGLNSSCRGSVGNYASLVLDQAIEQTGSSLFQPELGGKPLHIWKEPLTSWPDVKLPPQTNKHSTS